MVDAKKFKIDAHKATKEEVQAGLELLEKDRLRKAKIAAGEIKGGQKWSELTPEQKESRKASTRRRNVALILFKEKAEAAGIKVTDKEIDDRIALMAKAAK